MWDIFKPKTSNVLNLDTNNDGFVKMKKLLENNKVFYFPLLYSLYKEYKDFINLRGKLISFNKPKDKNSENKFSYLNYYNKNDTKDEISVKDFRKLGRDNFDQHKAERIWKVYNFMEKNPTAVETLLQIMEDQMEV